MRILDLAELRSIREGRALIEFRLLGHFEVWRDGDRVALGGRMQRAVLTALLVRAGRVVSLDQLIEDLWPRDPPARAAASVQVFVKFVELLGAQVHGDLCNLAALLLCVVGVACGSAVLVLIARRPRPKVQPAYRGRISS